MSTASIAQGKNANLGLEETFRRSGRTLPPAQAIARVARAIWPTKTDKELSVRTDTSDRACRDLLAERGGMSLDAFVRLLGCDEGDEFLDAVLGDAEPAWRRHHERAVQLGRLREEIELQRRRIAELETEAGVALSARRAGRAAPTRR